MNCFEAGYHKISLFSKGDHEEGLYQNQLGAIGATLSHFSTNVKPALISMPTGTGKTAVMILLSYIFKSKKALVITPSQLVRHQIAEQFETAKLLVRNNIISRDHLPKVYELTSIEKSKDEWTRILSDNDVCVAIPSTLSQIIANDPPIPKNAFDIVFVDEAHHSRAKTWTSILTYFENAKNILLTATPFRRDNKDLRARLIYNFPLVQAYQNGLFSKINYIPVKGPPGYTELEINILIAQKLEESFRKRAYHAHKIIIRTDSKSKADELLEIYKQNTSLKLVEIHSNLTDNTITKRIAQLKNNEIDGIICVDMMGEGFDFPLLKYAAVHVPHKSLSITLQFVGRISRTNIEQGNIATVVASEHEMSIDATQLYKENSDWSIILPDLHRSRVDKATEEQEFSESFKSTTDDVETPTTEPVSPEVQINEFKPFFHVKLYKILNSLKISKLIQETDEPPSLIDIFKPIDFSASTTLLNPFVRHTSQSIENNTAIYIVSQRKIPDWVIDQNNIQDITNELIILFYDQKASILFICSTIRETELYELIANSVVHPPGIHEMIYMPHLKRLIAGWENARMFNVGMKSRKNKGNSESYKQILGPQAENGVMPTDKLSYTRGHSFGGGYDTILKREVLLGLSTSSKVWSLEEKKVLYLIKWCKELALKASDPSMDKLSIPLSDLDAGEIVETFPSQPIFFADWDGEIYFKNWLIDFVDSEGVLHDAESLLCSCKIEVGTCTGDKIELLIVKGEMKSRLLFSITPIISYEYSPNTDFKILVRQGAGHKTPEHFIAILLGSPIDLFYEDLSRLSGKVLFKPIVTIAAFPQDHFIRTSWPPNVNVHKEYPSPEDIAEKVKGNNVMRTIHEYILDLCQNDSRVVFYDHASLEIADIIAFQDNLIRFYHCKKQSSAEPRCSIDDMTEVISQAIKSVHWSTRKVLLEQLIRRADRNKISEKLTKGTIADIQSILDKMTSPSLPIEIIIVQPGLKSTDHTTNQASAFNRISILLTAAQEYLEAVSPCTLKVMCS